MGNIESKEKVKLKQIKLKDILGNIKSKYILQKILNNLEMKKVFNIVKYNKNIKNRLDITINDYEEYSRIYSSIEIDIKLANNKFGKFINIDKNNEKYFHLYFDNNKEEILRGYIKKMKK